MKEDKETVYEQRREERAGWDTHPLHERQPALEREHQARVDLVRGRQLMVALGAAEDVLVGRLGALAQEHAEQHA